MRAVAKDRRALLALFPHPDDEAYTAAGLLAHCAASGVRVALVCATRGERGGNRTCAMTGNELAAVRTDELRESCRALGIEPPKFLDLPDGELAAVDPPLIAERVVETLQRESPQVIVTLGADGAYGNLDHIACTAAVGAAVERWDPAARTRLLHVVFPSELFAPVWRSLRRSRHRHLISARRPNPFGVAREEVHWCLDVRAHRERKLAALGAHRTQLHDGDPLTFLIPGLVTALLDEEWYVVARGPALPPDARSPFDAIE